MILSAYFRISGKRDKILRDMKTERARMILNRQEAVLKVREIDPASRPAGMSSPASPPGQQVPRLVRRERGGGVQCVVRVRRLLQRQQRGRRAQPRRALPPARQRAARPRRQPPRAPLHLQPALLRYEPALHYPILSLAATRSDLISLRYVNATDVRMFS